MRFLLGMAGVNKDYGILKLGFLEREYNEDIGGKAPTVFPHGVA